jgi:hypothetical protein
MTDSIVSTISRFLTPELIGKMGSASGLDRSTAQKAVEAIVPTILGGITALVAKPGGARQLANAIPEQPADMLSAIAGGLDGSAQMADRGRSLLSSLLGTGTLGVIASTVAKFLGIGEASTRTLIGLLTPVVLGVLGRTQQAAGLDVNGLARMLSGQKDEIAAAIPPRLANLLQASGLPETITSSSPERAPPRTSYDQPEDRGTGTILRRAAGSRADGRGAAWPYWVLPLLALAGLVWYMLPRNEVDQRTTEPARTSQTSPTQTSPTTSPPAPAPQQAQVTPEGKNLYLTKASEDWVSIGDYYNQDIYNRAGEKIGTIKNLLVGPDGKIAAAVVNVGRTLGLGDKNVAVVFSALQTERHDNTQRIVMDTTKEAMEAAPGLEQRKQ